MRCQIIHYHLLACHFRVVSIGVNESQSWTAHPFPPWTVQQLRTMKQSSLSERSHSHLPLNGWEARRRSVCSHLTLWANHRPASAHYHMPLIWPTTVQSLKSCFGIGKKGLEFKVQALRNIKMVSVFQILFLRKCPGGLINLVDSTIFKIG